MTHIGPIGRLGHHTATHSEHIAAAGLELQMIQADPSYRFTSERTQRTSHKYGADSVSLLALTLWLHLATSPTRTWVVALVSHKRRGRRVLPTPQ